ncbi:protein hook homolog 3 [Stylonychia lemnae]|uniref:Protein hook homolog 3 n=1 Tax=Stylonychia lemnae TaxID=5949 RepID=A0A078AFC3_STYLE|nr:protein hook homolog 3 [Stylonychia lemnae]|eukprot:CDW80227.1 protein hook homolog 3 [Stylonychia lemnae]
MSRAFEYHQIDSLQSSILEWFDSFNIEHIPDTFTDLYNGIALFEVLNKVDIMFWPRNKILTGPISDDQSISNFNNILSGLDKYYHQKLDCIINSQTAQIDSEKLVIDKEQSTLYDIIELIMGTVINCEDKQEYIERMLNLDEKTQEDLKKLIEKALNRMSVEMSEASQVSDSTAHLEMQSQIERLERERKLLREKIQEVENESRSLKYEVKEKNLLLKNLEQQVQQLSYEKELRDMRGSKQELDLSGLKGIGELEAQISFKDKEIQELKHQIEEQKNNFKTQIKEYKEEIQETKERLMKQQKSEAQMEVYKQMIEEVTDLRKKVNEYETQNNKLSMQTKTLEHEVKESEKYKNAIEFLKEELKKTKQDYHMQQLELEKSKSLHKETSDKNAKLEKKFAQLEKQHQSARENLEIAQSKLSVYEENQGFSKLARSSLTDFQKIGEEDLQEKVNELERQLRDLENENRVLRIENQSELNTQVLIMEQKIIDLSQEIEKYKNSIDLKEQKIRLLEDEIDGLRNKVDLDYDQREQKHDMNKEILKLKIEKDQQREKLEKLIKKLEQKKTIEADLKTNKEEKLKLEEEIRKVHREKADEREQSLKLQEEKIRLQSQVMDFELKLSSLSKDNDTLEKNLRQIQDENQHVRSSNNETAIDIQNKFTILKLETERDQLKWSQEKQEIQNKLNQYEKLHSSKEQEFKIKEDQLKQKLNDEVRSIEDSYKEEVDRLNQIHREKQLDLLQLKSKFEEQDMEHHRTNAFLSSAFYNLGYEHIKSQKDNQIQSMSWLDKQRYRAFNTSFDMIYNPN